MIQAPLPLQPLLHRWAERDPHAPSITTPDGATIGRGATLEQARSIGRRLRAAGIARNDRVALLVPNGPAAATAFLGTAAYAACAPINPAYRPAEIDRFLEDVRARALLVAPPLAAIARDLAEPRGITLLEIDESRTSASTNGGEPDAAELDDVALVLQTSGTTSRPKTVPLTHRNIAASRRNIATTLGLGEDDRCLNVMPLFHVHGLVAALLASLEAGGSIACTPGFSGPHFLDWLEATGATWYTAVPTIHDSVLARPPRATKARLRFIRSSSAPLPARTAKELEGRFGVPVIEAYGMTEAAHQMTSNPLPPRERKLSSVGQAIGIDVAIFDAKGASVPSGTVGDVVIRGPSVVASYDGNEAANGEAYVNGWFRTGDLGRLDADGYLFLTGRAKELINRGGEKVSPREVEDALLEHASVQQAVAFAIPDERLGEEVGAAVVLRSPATERELRVHCAARVAAFKVPRQVLIVDEVPKGATGKFNRAELAKRVALERQREAPSSLDAPDEVVKRVTEVFKKVLHVTQVGAQDDFFRDLPGDSILAVELLARLRDELGVELTPLDFIDRPSVAGVVTCRATSPVRLLERAVGQPRPTHGQERVWRIDRVVPGALARPEALRIRGPLDTVVLGKCLDEVVRRHESLRTTFHLVDGRLTVIVGDAASVPLAMVDAIGASELDLSRVVSDVARGLVDLTTGPVLRATLVRAAPEDHVLVFSTHHLVFDGWSARLLHRELDALYAAMKDGTAARLPELKLRVSDLAAWQRSAPLSEAARALVRTDSPTPQVELPADRARLARPHRTREELVRELPGHVVTRAKALAREEAATLFSVLLAGFVALLQRFTGQTDLAVSVPLAGRTHTELESSIGLLATNAVVRLDLSADPSFRELVRATRVEIARWLTVQSEADRVHLESGGHEPTVVFQLRNLPARPAGLGPLEATPYPVSSGRIAGELEVELEPTESGLSVRGAYAAEIFDASTIDRLVECLGQLLESACEHPERRVSALSLLDARRRDEVLHDFNRFGPEPAERDETPLPVRFARVALERADAPAIEAFDGTVWTYAQVARSTRRLAARLVREGVSRNAFVGILVARSPLLVVASMAVLEAGGAQVVLDPTIPAERRKALLEDLRPAILITDRPDVGPAPAGTRTIVLDGPPETWGEPDDLPAGRSVSADDLAYGVFTSGSTGPPKCALNTHRGLSNTLLWLRTDLGLTPGSRILQHTALTFDGALLECLGALSSGATAVLGPSRVNAPSEVARLVAERRVTHLFAVPSMLRAVLDSMTDALDLRLVFAGGEVLPPDLARRFQERFPGATLVNVYGPAEVAIWATQWRYDPALAQARPSLPIGRPLANVKAHVLDTAREAVPVGVIGEIYLGGSNLGAGYLNRDALTAERFVADPFVSGARLYRTGDLGRYRPDGLLEYVGRTENVIKVHGAFVDTDAIVSALKECAGVQEAIVLPWQGPHGQRLAAYLVGAPGAHGSARAVRERLRQTLAEGLVPNDVVWLDKLPLSPNGKLDRRALPSPRLGVTEPRETARPRDELETEIAGLFASVLHRKGVVGLDEDFFDLGGDSLLAVDLFAMIEARYRIALPWATILEHPSVESLAAVIRRPEPSPSIVTLQNGEGAPVFFMQGLAGDLLFYRALVRRLEGLRLLGLRARGTDGREAPLTKLEEVGSHALAAIRAAQPVGPYRIVGASFGGAVAFEVAQQLVALGESVSLLGIIDTNAFRAFPGFRATGEVIRRHVSNLLTLPLSKKGPYLAEGLRRLQHRREAARLVERSSSEPLTGPGASVALVVAASTTAAVRYRPRPYPGHITLFKAREGIPLDFGDPALGWTRLASVTVHELPGDHNTILQEPYVAAVAARIEETLRTKG